MKQPNLRASDPNLSAPWITVPESLALAQAVPYLSVVIPVYQAATILPALLERLTLVLDKLNREYELILVCDGSPDDSWTVLNGLVKDYPRLCAVNLSRNFGQHYATTAGLDFASGEWTVVMDCDLQDAPEEIPRLLEKANDGYDIVVARRMQRQHRWWKRVTSRLFFRAFSALSGFKMDGSAGSFRIMRRPVVNGLTSMREAYRMFGGLVEWLGFKTGHVDVQHSARYDGESSYDLAKLVRMAMDGMISFSNRPLYISIAMGMIISAASGLYGIFLLLRAYWGATATLPGWLSTMTASAFIGGLILLNQGILGIYLGRLYNQAKQRPLYVVDRITLGKNYKDRNEEANSDE